MRVRDVGTKVEEVSDLGHLCHADSDEHCGVHGLLRGRQLDVQADGQFTLDVKCAAYRPAHANAHGVRAGVSMIIGGAGGRISDASP